MVRSGIGAMLLIVMSICLVFTACVGLSSAAEPIKLGCTLAITGWAGFIGTHQREMYLAMIDDINSNGGVNGRPLELYYEDDQSNPTNAVVAATKLIKDKKVLAIVGTSIQDSAFAMVPISENEETVFINTGPADLPINKKWVFSVGPGNERAAVRLMEMVAKDFGAKHIAILTGTNAYGMMGQKVFNREISKYPGASIVIQESFNLNDTSMIPQLMKIKRANVDALILFTEGTPGSIIAKNYKQLGMDVQIFGSDALTTPENIKISGNLLEEEKWIFLGQPMMIVDKLAPDDPFRKDVYEPALKIMQKKYGPQQQVTLFHASIYDCMIGTVEALKIAGPNVTRASFRDALEKVNIPTSFLGGFAPTPTNHQVAPRAVMRPMVFRNGAFWPYEKDK